MSIKLQGPQIGNALRVALDLPGAGGMPLDFEPTITPVAIVADVREQQPVNVVGFQGYAVCGAVAGQYSTLYLDYAPAGVPLKVREILVDKLHINSGLGQGFYWGVSDVAQYAGQVAGPIVRRTDVSLIGTAGASSVGSLTFVLNTASGPGVLFSGLLGFGAVQVGVTQVIEFPTPVRLSRPGHRIIVQADSVNTPLTVTFFGREIRT